MPETPQDLVCFGQPVLLKAPQLQLVCCFYHHLGFAGSRSRHHQLSLKSSCKDRAAPLLDEAPTRLDILQRHSISFDPYTSIHRHSTVYTTSPGHPLWRLIQAISTLRTSLAHIASVGWVSSIAPQSTTSITDIAALDHRRSDPLLATRRLASLSQGLTLAV